MENLKKYFLTVISLSFVVLISTSCQESKSGKIKDLDAIRSKSNYRSKPKPMIKTDVFQDFLTAYNQDSVELSISRITKDTTQSFFDQFIYEQSERFNLIDSNQHVFNHQFTRFKLDSANVKNNFFNWFDKEFCQRNLAIRMYMRVHLYPKNIFFVCTNQSIHVIKSENKIDPFKWIKLIQLTEKKVDFIYICYQAKNKEALWFSFEQNKLNLIPA